MSLSTFFYNTILGEQSPSQNQATYNTIYAQVKAAGGTDQQAKDAATQAISPAAESVDAGSLQINDSTSYYALTGKQGTVSGALGSAVDEITTKLGDAVGNVISGKLLLALIVVAAILFFWKE